MRLSKKHIELEIFVGNYYGINVPFLKYTLCRTVTERGKMAISNPVAISPFLICIITFKECISLK